jgi:hypothetical protein
MGKCAKAGTILVDLLQLSLPFLKQAECNCRRTGRGAKPEIPEWLIAGLIMIALLQRKKTKSSQYRYFLEHREEIAKMLGDDRLPARATYFRRYRRAKRLYKEAIRLQGEQAVLEGLANPQDVVVDKSLIEALGPAWHKQDREAGHVPKGVDRDSTWGRSEYDGWVQGYSYEVVVCATPGSVVFPLLASVDVASASETRSFADKIDLLPEQTITVSLDSGYDANHLAERVEYDAHGQRTGRHYFCPENPRNNQRAKTKPCHADVSRARSRKRRHQRLKSLRSPRGRRIYARRKKTVEPFHHWFKSLFELDHKVRHRGLENNQTQILGALFVYQLLLRYNHSRDHRNSQVCWILDAL